MQKAMSALRSGRTSFVIAHGSCARTRDASVPFLLDVHAFFSSKDAVGIETMLRQHFVGQRVNLVNSRREYFYATSNTRKSRRPTSSPLLKTCAVPGSSQKPVFRKWRRPGCAPRRVVRPYCQPLRRRSRGSVTSSRRRGGEAKGDGGRDPPSFLSVSLCRHGIRVVLRARRQAERRGRRRDVPARAALAGEQRCRIGGCSTGPCGTKSSAAAALQPRGNARGCEGHARGPVRAAPAAGSPGPPPSARRRPHPGDGRMLHYWRLAGRMRRRCGSVCAAGGGRLEVCRVTDPSWIFHVLRIVGYQ